MSSNVVSNEKYILYIYNKIKYLLKYRSNHHLPRLVNTIHEHIYHMKEVIVKSSC